MSNNEINRLDMESINIVDENIEKIGSLFPNVIVESEKGKTINFDLLKQELSKTIVEGNNEKYQLTWPGKKESIVNANTPTNKTLRPVKEKSVDFDNTQNIYIEGDNLEVLKILQESYLNKVKCIYIDPPYNRGSDLIYKDTYGRSLYEEQIASKQIDEENNRLVTNNLNDGKFHSRWLSMMSSRIKLAKSLLTQDGTIFISIDDNELFNLKLLCDSIFGISNFVTAIPRICSYQRSGQEMYMNISHDYILCYSYNYDFNAIIKKEYDQSKIKIDKNGKYMPGDTKAIFAAFSQGYSKGGDYDFEYNGTLYKPEDSNGNRNRWLWTKDRMEAAARLGILVETGRTLRMQLYLDKKFEEGTNTLIPRDEKLKFHTADFMKEKFDNPIGARELKNLFDGKEYFDNPKPVNLIKFLIELATNKEDIVLDFFSGSATTAEAILKINSEDKKNRRFILVQVGEKISEDKQAYKDGYRYIYDIGEERIRRAAKKIKEETKADIDYGFRVYKVDTSNMKDVYYEPSKLEQTQLNMFESNIKEDRTPEDLLTQVILDLGLTLDLKIEEKNILSHKVYFVAENSLVACFDNQISIDIVNEICKVKPLKIVFRESSFKNDSDKINTYERIKKLSPETEINVI